MSNASLAQNIPKHGIRESRDNYNYCKVQRLQKEEKHWALRPQKPLRLIRDGEVGGLGVLYLTPTLSPPEWFCIKVGSCVGHFNVSLIVWAKSQDSVRKPQFLKRRERRAEADRTEVLLLTSQVSKCLTARPHRLTRAKGGGGGLKLYVGFHRGGTNTSSRLVGWLDGCLV